MDIQQPPISPSTVCESPYSPNSDKYGNEKNPMDSIVSAARTATQMSTPPPLGKRSSTGEDEPSRHGPLGAFGPHLIAMLGEFCGTFMFLWMSYAGQIMVLRQSPASATGGGPSSTTVVYIAMVYAFALMTNVWLFYRVSGGQFNPAISFGLFLAGAQPWTRLVCVIPAQLLASLAAGFLADTMTHVPLAGVASIGSTTTTLAAGVSTAQGLFVEVLLTAQLAMAVLMLAVEKGKHTFLAPLGIGAALFVALVPGVFFTGGSLNPARSLGSAVAGREFVGYHWIYWLGPAGGAALAAGVYTVLKRVRYECANPGQDGARGGFLDMA